MTKAQRTKLILEAKELGLKSVTIDGVTFELAAIEASRVHMPVPELEAKELVNPMSPFDDLSDDEIQYWATPYYDELQDLKTKRAQQLKDEGQ